MLVLLVGPKGSGKSHIGRLLESDRGVHFFHVEPYWMEYHRSCASRQQPIQIDDGIKHVHPKIVSALGTHEHVCVETTGASSEILNDLLSIGSRFGLLLVKVKASLSIALARISTRDSTTHIPVDIDTVMEIYKVSNSLELRYDVVVDNEDLSDTQILQHFSLPSFRQA